METFFSVTFAAVRFSISKFEYYCTHFANTFDLFYFLKYASKFA